MPIFNNGQMGLMPGELNGIPNGYGVGSDYGQGGFGGLLSGDNPLLNVGFGILANNHGNYGSFSAAIGKGGLQGIQQTQQARQLAQQKQLRDLQMQQEQQKMEEYRAQQDALKDFDIKHPEYAGLARLDPKSALKIAYPALASNTADPYTTIEYDGNGNAFMVDHRATDPNKVLQPVMVGGKQFTGAKYSPTLQGNIEQSKAGGKAAYNVNTDIPGKVLTGRQVAEMADPSLGQLTGLPPQPQSLPQLPQANVQGNFNGNPQAIMSQINRISDPQERANALQAFTQQYGQMQPAPQQQLPAPVSNSLVGGGIRVPTPAEQAALTEQAKAAAELKTKATTQAQIDLPTTVANAQQASRQIDELIGSRDGRIKPHPGFVPAVGASSKFDPRNYLPGTDATDFNTRLDQLKGGQFLQAFNSLRGGGAITEIEGKKATDAIARMNTAQTEEEFVKSARDYQDVIDAGLKRQQEKAGMTGNQQSPTTSSTVRKYNPKTGRIE